MKKMIITVITLCSAMALQAQQTPSPAACGPVPNENQMRWQEMEFYAFIHFSTNTFTDQEWGDGSDPVSIFNPAKLDCREWAKVCSEVGMKGIIITAKHHSGFCLWPSKYTDYSVKNCPWKNGQGDILRDLSQACKEYGLKLGVYLSPWDRNRADYGQPSYIEYFRNQLRELLTEYGDIFEVWFDGANGGWGYYGGARENRNIDRAVYYDWPNTIKLIRELQPNAIIWNECGPDIRWCGNEQGRGNATCWSLLDSHKYVPGASDFGVLNTGMEDGPDWVPYEVNVSIRPGWFYHKYEDRRVKNISQLLDIYYNSIGRNGTWLLNFPINPDGLIDTLDWQAVKQLHTEVQRIFKTDLARSAKAEASNVRGGSARYAASRAIDGRQDTYWATDDGVKTASLTLNFKKPTRFNRVLLQEYIRLGQRVKTFKVEAEVDGQWKQVVSETTIGYKRILRFATLTATRLRISITDSKACPLISNVGVYEAPQVLSQPRIVRHQNGDVVINAVDGESAIYYTLDGSTPTLSSTCYTTPFVADGRVTVKAIAADPHTKTVSLISNQDFGISRRNWKVISSDAKAQQVIDGEDWSSWHQRGIMPIDLEIDLGEQYNVCGFRYLPDQSDWMPSGFISHYEFYVSADGSEWKKCDEGEFPNIRNNPSWQKKEFRPIKARYIRLRALSNCNNDLVVGYSEIDIMTR